MQQTAVTPFIIACSAIESIGSPFAHRSGLCRFATTQRSQSTSALQRAPCDADTANRTVDAPEGADGGVHCRFAAKISCKVRQDLAPCFVTDDLRAKGRYFVLCALKRRLRAAVLASSRNLCNAANPMRRAKSPALQSRRERAATHKRQPSARPAGGPMKSSAPTQGTEQPVAREAARRQGTVCRPPFRRPSALHCRAGVHARRGALS